MGAGWSSRPSVRERWPERAESAAEARDVGIGGPLAGKEGVTVRGASAVEEVVVVAGFATGLAAVVVAVDVVGFAAVEVEVEGDVEVAARGVLFEKAEDMGDEEKVRGGMREAEEAFREELRREEIPRRAAIVKCGGWLLELGLELRWDVETRSHDSADWSWPISAKRRPLNTRCALLHV